MVDRRVSNYHPISMRPIVHPSIQDVTVEAILHALSDPVRVALFAEIIAQECSSTCTDLSHLIPKPIPKSTLSHHFKALREAGLIHGERRGVEMYNTSRCTEIDHRFPGLLAAIANAHNIQAAGKKAPRPLAKAKPSRKATPTPKAPSKQATQTKKTNPPR